MNVYLWRGVVLASLDGGRLTGFAGNATFYSLPVVALFAFAVLFALSSAFIRERWVRVLAAILSLIPAYLLIPYSPVVLVAAAATALGGWYAVEAIAGEYAASSSFSVRKILRGGLPVFFTSVALVLSAFYWVPVSGETRALLPRALFDSIIPFLQGPLQSLLPGFRADATVDEVILELARRQAGDVVDIVTLSPALRRELLAAERKRLGEQFGLTLTGQEQLGDLIYQVMNEQTSRFLGPYRGYLPLAAAAAFFITVKTLTIPLYWITLLLVWGVVQLLVRLGVLHQRADTVQVVRVEL